MLCGKRPKAAGGRRRGGYERERTGVMDLTNAPRDELVGNGRRIGLGEQIVHSVIGTARDALQYRARILISRL